MDKIIESISAYNIFTNLFPGVMYCFISEKLFGIPLIQDDLIVALFLYYFVGMVISRISSVALEPLLKATRVVKLIDYQCYIVASAKDEKIGLLLETANSYRSVIALLLCILATGAWSAVVSESTSNATYPHYILIAALIGLFLLAYRKQAQYIAERVKRHGSIERPAL